MANAIVAINSANVRGITAAPVKVELQQSMGIPGIAMVGMPDAITLQSRERVRAALRSQSFELPRNKVTINLAPTEMRKTGAGLDLAIAVAILCSTGQLQLQHEQFMFIGELSLSGTVEPVQGLVAYQRLAKQLGLKLVVSVRSDPTFLEPDTTIFINQLRDLAPGGIQYSIQDVEEFVEYRPPAEFLDYADVAGQEETKYALMLAAIGNLGLIMVGPPGAGKSMLAERFPGILPPLSEEEIEEVALIASVMGAPLTDIQQGIRPFRKPHHSSSVGGLVGGGRPLKPGEISLAHKGVLFLDELPEFQGPTLQALRQPMEQGKIVITRVDGTYEFPCEFSLLAAANPCPCGNLGIEGRKCTCAPARIATYQHKMAGPIGERIDMHVHVPIPDAHKVVEGTSENSTESMRKKVFEARDFASERQKKMSWRDDATVFDKLNLNGRAKSYLESMAANNGLSARSIVRTARIARSISDFNLQDMVGIEEISQALLYRSELE